MKFKVYSISHDKDNLQTVLKEASKVAAYNELDEKSAMRLELLAEELIDLLPYFSEEYEGEFWIESDDRRYELHVSMDAQMLSKALQNERKVLLDEKKKNKLVGFFEKIREAVDKMAMNNVESPENKYYFEDMQTEYNPISQANQKQSYAKTWRVLRHNIEDENTNALEKSIFASLADDVLIGVVGNKIDIIVPKTF